MVGIEEVKLLAIHSTVYMNEYWCKEQYLLSIYVITALHKRDYLYILHVNACLWLRNMNNCVVVRVKN